ncbi:MAG TPA: RnfH family protein [Burkholderiales bacterium]|nr:RnfH family protein [Burkholderiales bacterium]
MAESGIDAERPRLIHVEVVYARPEEQVLLALEVGHGATVGQVIKRSGILDRIPEIGGAPARVGIFGRSAELTALVQEGDRIEIYRPLIADPKQQRQARETGNRGRKSRRG